MQQGLEKNARWNKQGHAALDGAAFYPLHSTLGQERQLIAATDSASFKLQNKITEKATLTVNQALHGINYPLG